MKPPALRFRKMIRNMRHAKELAESLKGCEALYDSKKYRLVPEALYKNVLGMLRKFGGER